MQQKNKRHFIATLFMAGVSAILLSFTSLPGGDMFEIYVNNQLVLQQHTNNNTVIQNLSWSKENPNDEIYIRYTHCGETGKNRSIAIKNSQNKVLRSWQFEDLQDKNNICKIKDILDLQKTNGTLYIYYSSKEIPNGKLLVTINNG